jgi:hypothetical protein
MQACCRAASNVQRAKEEMWRSPACSDELLVVRDAAHKSFVDPKRHILVVEVAIAPVAVRRAIPHIGFVHDRWLRWV